MEMEENEETKTVRVVSKKKPLEIKLQEPIEWGTETIEKIVLKPPRGKHLRGLPVSPGLNDILKLASKISGVSSAVFDEMCSEDVMRVVDAVGELL